jgi:outer membrane protein assembly factor BamB
MRTLPALAVTACLLCCAPVRAADWPQWGGPNRDGVSPETGLLKEWPKGGPKLLWSVDTLGQGYSAPAVVGDRLYVLGTSGTDEVLLTLDAATGKPVGSAVKIGPVFTFKGNLWGNGPRSTPTVDGDRVYALGGQGILFCADATKGELVWSRNLPKDAAGEVNPIGGGPAKLGWGWSWSPLVDGDRLVCVPGGPKGTVAALDKKTGDVLWRSADLKEQATYSSPVAADLGGVRQYVVMTIKGTAGVAAKDGKLLWKYDRKPEYNDVVINTPLVRDNLVWTTVGMGFPAGCDLIEVAGKDGSFEAKKVYSKPDLANISGGPVLVGDHVYGFSTDTRVPGWVCLEFKTGKVVWNDDKIESGPVAAADGNLYVLGEETGAVVLAAASPKGWQEKGRFELPKQTKQRPQQGKIWTHPVIADGKLYLRDQELLFCYSIK